MIKISSFILLLLLTAVALYANVPNYKLVAEYVPVREVATGRVGLYEVVLGNINFSASGTDFNVDVTNNRGRLPAGYVELESISATASQYIDTKIVAKKGVISVLDVVAVPPISGNTYMLAAYASEAEAYLLGLTSSGNYLVGLGKSNRYMGGDITKRNVVRTSILDGNAYSVEIGDERIDSSVCSYAPTSVYSLHLFGRNEEDTPGRFATATLYSAKIYTNDVVLARDYVPCLHDGEAGLYDLVSGNFYGSQTESKFVAGKVLEYGEVLPKVGGVEVGADELFTVARTDKPISFDGSIEIVGGIGGINKLVFGGNMEVVIPDRYIASVRDGKVYLALNEAVVKPEIGGDDAMTISDDGIVLYLSKENVREGLYYGVSMSTSPTGGWSEPAEWVGGKADGSLDGELRAPRAGSDSAAFYRVNVTDIRK